MAVCTWCGEEMLTSTSCRIEALHQGGIRRAFERSSRRCTDCGIDAGGLHHIGCCDQRCPVCGGQLIGCGCRFDEDPEDPDDGDGFEDFDDEEWDTVVSLLRSATSSRFEGRSFTTEFEMPVEPVWEPLAQFARRARGWPVCPDFHEGEFMYMGSVRNARKGLTVHLYKHVDTRRYLNLDDVGNAYAYRPSEHDEHGGSCGRYQQYRFPTDAIDRVELWLFDEEPPLYRSFPPDAWPATG